MKETIFKKFRTFYLKNFQNFPKNTKLKTFFKKINYPGK